MHDKDLAGVVGRLAALVDAWYCTDLPSARAASAAELATCVRASHPGVAASAHGDPAAALAAAVAAADPADRILVFGSFLTVGGVLRQGLPRLGARHAA
jgi:dihydrofolate synthase/folylpolyglutamate synthase